MRFQKAGIRAGQRIDRKRSPWFYDPEGLSDLAQDYVDNMDAGGAGFIRRFAAGLHGSSSLQDAGSDRLELTKDCTAEKKSRQRTIQTHHPMSKDKHLR